MESYHILVVDDELANLESLERILKSDAGRVTTCRCPHEAMKVIRRGGVDILLTDLRMGSMGGMELLETTRFVDATIEIILMTAYGTVEVAVEAMKKGAYDFVSKPLQRIQLLRTVHKAWEKRKLVNENQSLREELKQNFGKENQDIVGKTPTMLEMLDITNQAASCRANVLIEGASGTGKGLLAETIHNRSPLNQGILVKINCSAIPENLLEAELFGYEPGAFTGATKRKKGRVELADGGTLFLDEIGIAPLSFQAKLLRFLQDGEFERLGSNETQRVNARVIAATNTDLKRAMAEGKFREDLYYRLNVIHIHVPSLAERGEDIPLLVQKFLEQSAKKNGRCLPLVEQEAMQCLMTYAWPGNIRELQNLVERMVVLNKTGIIRMSDLPSEISANQVPRMIQIPIGFNLKEAEATLIRETLKSTKGDKRLAAQLLGIHPRTIYRHLEAKAESRSNFLEISEKSAPVEL